MARTHLAGLFFFFASIDNFGVFSQAAIVLLGVLCATEKIKKNLLYLFSVPCAILVFSAYCLDSYFVTIGFIFIKVLAVTFFFSTGMRFVSEVIKLSLFLHIGTGVFTYMILLSPLAPIYTELVLFDVSAIDAGLAKVRPIGFYDEPSTYGFSLLVHLFILLIGEKNRVSAKLMAFPIITFSTPVQLLSILMLALRKQTIGRSLIFLLVLPALLGAVFLQYSTREDVYKFSPLALRTVHFIEFAKDPPYFYGRGLCSAYGQYDLELPKSDLRNLSMSNFKDAGQVLFMADRVGLLLSLMFYIFIMRKLGIVKSSIFIAIYFVLKIPFYSFLILTSLGAILTYEKRV